MSDNPWKQNTLAASAASWSDETLLLNMDRVDARLVSTSETFVQFVSETLHAEMQSREQKDAASGKAV